MQIGPLWLRDLTDADMPDVLGIYAASRGDEAHLALWPLQERAGFLQLQCRIQHHQYTQHASEHDQRAAFKLLELDGALVGRLYWRWSPNQLHLTEITVLPEFRGRGFATRLIAHLQGMATERGVALALHVANTNTRAAALYQRMGFAFGETDGVYQQMLWAGARAQPAFTATRPAELAS